MIGANVAICLVALGVGALIAPLPFDTRVHRYGLAGLLTGAVAARIAWDGTVDRVEGLVLVGAYVVFVAIIWIIERQPPALGETAELGEADAAAVNGRRRVGRELALVIAGVAAMAVGASVLVEAIRRISDVEATQTRLGLVVLGFATAFGLVVLAWSSARRGITTAVVAAVVGSFTYNVTMTLGAGALARPLRIVDAAQLRLPWVVMLAALLSSSPSPGRPGDSPDPPASCVWRSTPSSSPSSLPADSSSRTPPLRGVDPARRLLATVSPGNVVVMMTGSAIRRGMIRCGLAAVLFGATTPFASRLADDVSAPMLAGLLYLGAAVAVVPRVVSTPWPRNTIRRGGTRLAVAVAAGGLVGPLLLALGLQRTPAATASLLLNLELAATTVLAVVFFREHIGPRVWVGTAIVVAAGVIVGWSDVPELAFGAVLIAAACVCWGLDNCVTAELDTLDPAHITLAKGVIAGTTNVAIALVIGGVGPSGGALVAIVFLGAIGYGASITLWVSGARDIGAARGQLIFSAAPFVGVTVAWLVLGDDATAAQLVATALAAAGVFLVAGSDHEHRHAHDLIDHVHEHDHDVHHRDHHPDGTIGDGRHTHHHVHQPLAHAHPHVPDLHHRHHHDT